MSQTESFWLQVAHANWQSDFFSTHHLALSESEEALTLNNRGNFFDLFRRDRLGLTLTALPLFFVSAVAYYGTVLLGTTMLSSSNNLCGYHDANVSVLSKAHFCSMNPCV